jgi:hypothetical protein
MGYCIPRNQKIAKTLTTAAMVAVSPVLTAGSTKIPLEKHHFIKMGSLHECRVPLPLRTCGDEYNNDNTNGIDVSSSKLLKATV